MKYLLFCACIFFVSCGNNNTAVNNTTDASTHDTTTTAEPATVNNCYEMINKKDTVGLQLEVSGTVAKGMLQYNLHEKDKNSGSLQGIIRDSLLVADYTFMAEGKTSVRQVVFKMQGDTLFEGYGNVEMVKDTARFKNVNHLQFLNNRPFIKKDCEQQ